MLPLSDVEKPDRTPIFNWLIIAANIAVWVFIQGAMFDESTFLQSVCDWSFVPNAARELSQIAEWQFCRDYPRAPLLTAITAMFLHGGWGHIISNLWFLHIFGDNVEDRWGHLRYLFFYLLCGVAGTVMQFMMNPTSEIPNLGASGAISGISGAYLVFFPHHRVRTLFIFGFFWRIFELRAWFMLLYWLAFQVLGVLAPSAGNSGGVAYGAHLGGFAMGVFLALLTRGPQRRRRQTQWI